MEERPTVINSLCCCQWLRKLEFQQGNAKKRSSVEKDLESLKKKTEGTTDVMARDLMRRRKNSGRMPKNDHRCCSNFGRSESGDHKQVCTPSVYCR
jgi:DNA polymerase elongation subunit (family B)